MLRSTKAELISVISFSKTGIRIRYYCCSSHACHKITRLPPRDTKLLITPRLVPWDIYILLTCNGYRLGCECSASLYTAKARWSFPCCVYRLPSCSKEAIRALSWAGRSRSPLPSRREPFRNILAASSFCSIAIKETPMLR